MAIQDNVALDDRAEALQKPNPKFNGIRHIIIKTLNDTSSPPYAEFTLQFYNTLHLNDIISAFNSAADKENIASEYFTISGGHHVPVGTDEGNVRVTGIAPGTADSLELTISPIGDYSTYTLKITDKCPGYDAFDPVFICMPFKFRPGCFSLNCKPDDAPLEGPGPEPVIDYLARDFDSFKHTLISAMMERVPGWRATSEADLDQVLIDLFGAAADELADYHDRVANEAYLGTARKRISLARHARFMDYHIHQGNQASTWLTLSVNTETKLPLGGDPPGEIPLKVSTAGNPAQSPPTFMSRGEWHLNPAFNDIRLYTWSNTRPALEAGCTTADLIFDTQAVKYNAIGLNPFFQYITKGWVTHLLIQEHRNPVTGKPNGTDPEKRQLLELIRSGDRKPVIMTDPVTGKSFIRVCWQEKDRLKDTYCFTVDCDKTTVEDVSLFHGNLVRVYHGKQVCAHFHEPGSVFQSDEYEYQRPQRYGKELGAVCRLDEGPLAFQNTLPGGEEKTVSTMEIFEGSPDLANPGKYIYSLPRWQEAISLVHSDDSSTDGNHFIVETDEEGNSLVRFGNGINGCELPEDTILLCRYQAGHGPDGNVGRDTLMVFDPAVYTFLDKCTNPFDVTDGRAPEPEREILRRVPEAFRHRQLRAVTLKDYEKRSEELPEVSHASARYVWTGSWRGVRIAIDPAGTDELSLELRSAVARHLDVVRLIGEDLEIRPPVFVPLEISVKACIRQDYWPEEIRYELEQEFSTGYTTDGRLSFFHPDLWTFGQGLEASQIIGRV